MKRYLFFIITGATLLWNTSSQAVGELGENGGNNTNPHNLSSLSSNNAYKAVSETQICIFCHVPHGATPQSTLWGRPDPTQMGSFPTLLSSSVQDPSGILGIDDPGIVGTTEYSSSYDYPNGASKLCLSCHDGVTAMGILGNGDEIQMTGGALSANFDIDLAVSHPISFVYNSTVQTYLNTLGKTDTYVLTTAAYLDGDSRVQCTTCHQPHQDTRNVSYNLPFWRGAGINDITEYDAICAACHTTTYSGLADHNYP